MTTVLRTTLPEVGLQCLFVILLVLDVIELVSFPGLAHSSLLNANMSFVVAPELGSRL